MKLYNIIWADDEIGLIMPESEWLEPWISHGINIMATVTNGQDLALKMIELEGRFDAVVVDANFNLKSETPNAKGERDVSGLQKALTQKEVLKSKGKDIPFILYTGRSVELLREEFPNGELDEIFNSGCYMSKRGAGLERLYRLIQDKVDLANTLEHQLRCRYDEEFRIAKKFTDAERFLMEGLLAEYGDETMHSQNLFNSARQLVEGVMSDCEKRGFLPKVSLNGKAHLLSKPGGEVEGYSLRHSIMPMPLASSLEFFLSITQDGSHQNPDLRLGVKEYVCSRNNNHLFFAILHIAMDLLIWYKDLILTDSDSTNIVYRNNKVQYEGEVKVYQQDGHIKYYVGKYQLRQDTDIRVGQKIAIIKSIPNRCPFEGVTEYATDYRLV